MLSLLIILVGIPSSAAGPAPQFVTLGEGRFEVFALEDGAVFATQQRNVSPFLTTYLLEKSRDAQGNLSISKTEVEAIKHKLRPEMLDPKAFSNPYLVSDFECCGTFQSYRSPEWITVNSGGREFILGQRNGELSPDRKKLILNDGLEREFLIYSCETGRVEVTSINYERKDKYIFDFPLCWFGHVCWSRDGKRIAYDSNKVGRKSGFSIWILDENGKDRCVLNSKINGPLLLLGWTFDNRLVAETDADEIRVYDLKGGSRTMAKNVFGCEQAWFSPDGRRMVVKRTTPQGFAYGQAIIDFGTGTLLEVPQLKGYNDNCTFAWSPDGKKVAFYLFNNAIEILAVAEVLPNGKVQLRTYESPVPGTQFSSGGSLNWFGDDVIVACLRNQTSIAMELK